MTDNNQNLTVLVKKKDGTFERVALADLKNRKSVAASVSAKPTTAIMLEPDQALANVDAVDFNLVPQTRKISADDKNKKPVVIKTVKDRSELFSDNSNNKKIANKITKSQVADFKNPLEDALPNTGKPRLPNDSVKIEQAQKIIASLSFKVPADLKNRLQSVTVLFLKDIRSKNQTQDILSRPVRAGGLDLTAENIKEFFDKALGAITSSNQLMREGELELANVTPFNAFIHDKLPPQNQPINQSSVVPQKSDLEKKIFDLNSQPVKKARMDDIVGGEKIYGPIEEIGNFSLVDLHRLSSSAEDAIKRLEQKFINIRTESVILYFQALTAWQKSPLYLEYINALVKSLKDNLSLDKVLQSNQSSLKLSEVNLLLKMEENLEI